MKRVPVPKEPVLAGLPIAIHTIGLVVSWLWSPLLFERMDYPVTALVVLAILIVGAAWGLAQRLPLWSYSWVILSLGGTGKLAGVVIAESAPSVREASTILVLASLATFFAVAVVASLLGFRGVRFAMFAILLSLLYHALGFPILEGWPSLSPVAASTVTSVFAALAMAEAALAVLIVACFLGAQGKAQIRSLYLLSAIVFVDRLLNGWFISSTVFEGSFWDIVVPAIIAIGSSWVITGITLLIVWALSKLALRLRWSKRESEPGVSP